MKNDENRQKINMIIKKHMLDSHRRVLENKNIKIIFQDLATHKVHTPEEISNGLCLSRADVIISLNNLIDIGLVLPISKSGVGSVIYSLSVEGLKLIRMGLDESLEYYI